MKLNLGCGSDIRPGYKNVDKFGSPDILWDLEMFPWPFDDNCAEEIILCHVLEHLGQQADVFLSVMKEIYRVCRHDARVHVVVPHPRHDNFDMDPTHVRPITIGLMTMFSLKDNQYWQEIGAPNTPLAMITGVDFEIEKKSYQLSEPYNSQYKNREITLDQLDVMIRERFNIVEQIEMTLRVIKP